MEYPNDPIAAATHPDPYPYYAALATQMPLSHDRTLDMWIAAGAEAVTAVLGSTHCRVRPPTEPIPAHLLGSPVAEVFPHLVRMSDGTTHHARKRAVSATLAQMDRGHIAAQSDRWAQSLGDRDALALAPRGVMDFAFRLPVCVVASLLGIPDAAAPGVALSVGDFVACLAPSSSAGQRERGAAATRHLLAIFRTLIAAHRETDTHTTLTALTDEDEIGRIAHRIGLLMQTYEATAGLIGNTLVALATDPALREQAATDPRTLRHVVAEVLRHDPPIQNTRRFLAEDGTVAGAQMRAGDCILVVLAAANRDPSVNPHPERFDATRTQRRTFTFGSGAHACPGDAIAATITEIGVARLIAAGLAPERLTETVTYRASVNARIPRRLPVGDRH